MFSAQKKRENQAEPFIVTITTNTEIQVRTEIEEGNSGASSNHSCDFLLCEIEETTKRQAAG